MWPLVAIVPALILLATLPISAAPASPGLVVLAIAGLATVPSWLFDRGRSPGNRHHLEGRALGRP